MINVKAYMCVPAGEDDNSVHKTQVIFAAVSVYTRNELFFIVRLETALFGLVSYKWLL